MAGVAGGARAAAGGTLRIGHFASPASMSMLEESTAAVNRPMMGVFNNLVMFKQDELQNTPDSIVPELATSWSWNEDGTELTFPLRQGVKWHDGKPFTAADVKCTMDLLQGKATEKLRINPRKSWFDNVAEVTTNGDYEVTFHLKRPQPSLLSMLATGLDADLSVPRLAGADAAASDRHRTVQICRVQAEPVDHGGRATRITGNRAGLISTASNTGSSPTSRRGCCRSSPATRTSYIGVTMPQLKDVKRQVPQAICDMFVVERRAQHAHQPRRAAVRQSRNCGGRWR